MTTVQWMYKVNFNSIVYDDATAVDITKYVRFYDRAYGALFNPAAVFPSYEPINGHLLCDLELMEDNTQFTRANIIGPSVMRCFARVRPSYIGFTSETTLTEEIDDDTEQYLQLEADPANYLELEGSTAQARNYLELETRAHQYNWYLHDQCFLELNNIFERIVTFTVNPNKRYNYNKPFFILRSGTSGREDVGTLANIFRNTLADDISPPIINSNIPSLAPQQNTQRIGSINSGGTVLTGIANLQGFTGGVLFEGNLGRIEMISRRIAPTPVMASLIEDVYVDEINTNDDIPIANVVEANGVDFTLPQTENWTIRGDRTLPSSSNQILVTLRWNFTLRAPNPTGTLTLRPNIGTIRTTYDYVHGRTGRYDSLGLLNTVNAYPFNPTPGTTDAYRSPISAITIGGIPGGTVRAVTGLRVDDPFSDTTGELGPKQVRVSGTYNHGAGSIPAGSYHIIVQFYVRGGNFFIPTNPAVVRDQVSIDKIGENRHTTPTWFNPRTINADAAALLENLKANLTIFNAILSTEEVDINKVARAIGIQPGFPIRIIDPKRGLNNVAQVFYVRAINNHISGHHKKRIQGIIYN